MLKLLGGRKGGATRGGKGGSHVHKEGKRLSDKAIRKLAFDEYHGLPKAMRKDITHQSPKNLTLYGIDCQDPPFTCEPPWCGYCNKAHKDEGDR